jgi:hypothetical protein
MMGSTRRVAETGNMLDYIARVPSMSICKPRQLARTSQRRFVTRTFIACCAMETNTATRLHINDMRHYTVAEARTCGTGTLDRTRSTQGDAPVAVPTTRRVRHTTRFPFQRISRSVRTQTTRSSKQKASTSLREISRELFP